MSFGYFRAFVMLAGLVAASALGQTSNGIYADFTTSMGNFTCQLDYTRAPKTVANFIGLATGQHPWVNPATGLVQSNAFYDGLTFHRVIAGFMNQAGSPNGRGTDGPGYAFPDEFNPQLTFSKAGVLAMANSGLDSNGSQFFVTVAPFTNGNNVYTIFGHVVGPTNVIWAINHVPTDSSDKPLTNVYIQHIDIRRLGTAANAFNISTQGLPLASNPSLQISKGTLSNVMLTFSNSLYADNQLFTTTSLTGPWTPLPLGIEIASPFTNNASVAATASAMFLRIAQVQYLNSTLSPKSVLDRTITLNFSGGSGTVVLKFNALGTGTYTYSGHPSGTIDSYTWKQQPYRALLWPIRFSGLVDMTLTLSFSTTTSGTFSGTAYTSPTASVRGTFTSTGP